MDCLPLSPAHLGAIHQACGGGPSPWHLSFFTACSKNRSFFTASGKNRHCLCLSPFTARNQFYGLEFKLKVPYFAGWKRPKQERVAQNISTSPT